MRKFPHISVRLLCLLIPGILFAAPYDSPAHHTSSIAYVLQKVGQQEIGNVKIELNTMPPKRIRGESARESPENTHALLSQFTHHFEMRVAKKEDDGSLPPEFGVKLAFAQGEWRKTFTLKRLPQRGVYGANVKLDEKGAYVITATISGLSPPPVRARFSFDFDPESVKDAMRGMEKTLGRLGQETLTLGLDGKSVPPQKERRIRGLAAKFAYLVPWTSNLREGDAQELYDEFTEKLRALSRVMTKNIEKPDYDRLAENLAAARTLCAQCHRIFQEADAEGRPIQSPRPSSAR